MDRRIKWIAGGAMLVAVAGGGTGIAATAADSDDAPLTGPALQSATEAALAHTPGTVVETEVGDEGAAYGVEVRREDGSEVEISLDESFTVISDEVDEDGTSDRDETGDD